MQLIVRVIEIALVVDQRLDLRVFDIGIGQHFHQSQRLQFAMQGEHRGAVIAIQIFADQGGVQAAGHAVVRPGIKVQAGANQLLLQLA